MFIQTEKTPNPSSLKFIPDADLKIDRNYDFTSKEAAVKSPLATRLFALNGIESVFLGANFITVTKHANTNWDTLQLAIMGTIIDHISSGSSAVEHGADNAEVYDENDSDIVKQIKELIATRVRPVVANDGGDIVFADFKDGIVYLYMKGACSGCPSATVTLKEGVERLLQHFIPEVLEVRAVR